MPAAPRRERKKRSFFVLVWTIVLLFLFYGVAAPVILQLYVAGVGSLLSAKSTALT
jgi:hypothetical protein